MDREEIAITMPSTKFEVKNFDGSNNFSLWKKSKMKNILIQQEVHSAIDEDFTKDIKEEKKKTILKKVNSCIELYLVDNLLG